MFPLLFLLSSFILPIFLTFFNCIPHFHTSHPSNFPDIFSFPFFQIFVLYIFSLQWHLHLIFLLFSPLELSNFSFPFGGWRGFPNLFPTSSAASSLFRIPNDFHCILFLPSLPLPRRYLAHFRQKTKISVSSSVWPPRTMQRVNIPELLARITVFMDNTSRASIPLFPQCDMICHVLYVSDSVNYRKNCRYRRRHVCPTLALNLPPLLDRYTYVQF